MVAKQTTPKRDQSAPGPSADFDGVLRRMLEMPPNPKAAKKVKKPPRGGKTPLKSQNE